MADASPLDPHREEHDSRIFPNLPDEVSIQCLARLPRSYYRSLSRVSKSWRSAFRSHTLYSTRKALKLVDFSFYFHIRLPTTNSGVSTTKWYEFFPPSNSTGTRSLFGVPSLPSALPLGASVVSVGAKIYVIGGSVDGIKTRTMWVYDLISDQWELVKPQLVVPRHYAASVVVNNKIYVMGGCDIPNLNWAEVFDPEIGAWSPLPSPNIGDLTQEGGMFQDLVEEAGMCWSCSVVNGKIIYYGMKATCVSLVKSVFDPSSNEWSLIHIPFNMGCMLTAATAVIDGVFYCPGPGMIRGYDFDANQWKVLKVVKGVFQQPTKMEMMLNMGGRLVGLWRKPSTVSGVMMIEVHAAVIEVQKDDKDRVVWGSVAWSGIVGKAPTRFDISDCVAVGL